jgi:hypothetical protein
MILADFTFWDALWSMVVFFLWILWFIVLFHVIGDIFRRRDAGGATKTMWLVFVLFLPFLGVFVYLLANGDDMGRRNLEQAQAQRAQMDDYVRTVAGSAGSPAAEIDKAKQLLDSGAITQSEFESIKAKALAAS